MSGETAVDVLWSYTDHAGDTVRLLSPPESRAARVLAELHQDVDLVDLDHDAVRRLRNACDRLLTFDDDRLSDEALRTIGRAVAVNVDKVSASLAQLVDAQGLLDGDRDPVLAGLLDAVVNLTRQVRHLASAVGRVP